MEEKYNAVVIRATNYKENDKIINLFTLEGGIVSAKLVGVKKANSKLKFAGEIFCFGEFVLIEKDDRRTVKEVNQIDSFYDLRFDLDKFYAGSTMAELVSKLLIDQMKSYELFLCFINALKTLNEKDIDAALVLATFILNAMKFQGYELDFEKCAVCGNEIKHRSFFSFSDGRSVCSNCAGDVDTEIRYSTYSLLKECSVSQKDISFNFLEKITFDENQLKNVLRFLDFALKQLLDINLKSLSYFTE